jgi:hypothetical protein
MAKQSINYAAPSMDLIKGAAAAYKARGSAGGLITMPDMSTPNSGAAKREASNNRVATFLNNIPGSDFSFANVPQNQLNAVKDYISEQRKKYADASLALGQFPPTSSAYADAMSTVTDAKNNILTLKDQINTFNTDKEGFLKDYRDGLISEGVPVETRDTLSKLYTDETPWKIEGGRIYGDLNGEMKSVTDAPDYFNKDVEIMNALSKYSATIYSNPELMQGPMRDDYRLNIMSVLSKNPQESIRSMTADYGIPFDMDKYGNDPNAMINAAADLWMEKLDDVAKRGAAAKAEQERKRLQQLNGGKGGPTNTDYQNTASNRLFTAIAQGQGFGNSMETEDIYMPGNASARKYKTQWSPNGVTFMTKGGKFFHPITGEEVVEATIGWADAASIWGFDTSQIPFLNSSDNVYNEEGTGPATTIDPEQRQRDVDAGNLAFRGITPGAARPGVLNNLGKTN